MLFSFPLHPQRPLAVCAALALALSACAADEPAAPTPSEPEASWEVLQQADFEEVTTPAGIEWYPAFPPEVERLDGAEVRLTGYMIPLTYEQKQTQFLVSAQPGDGCFFHLPGGPSAVAAVESPDGVAFTYDTVVLRGRLELLRADPDGLFYRLVEAEPVPSPLL